MSGERFGREYRRVGDTAKCPACGASMDPEAYRCPKCRIYFCFKCRRRVQPRDPQYQCMNQQCDQYGKLLCNACVVEVPVMGDRTREVLVEAGKPWFQRKSVQLALILLASLVVYGVCAGSGGEGRIWGLILAGSIPVLYITLSNFLHEVPPVYETVTENVEVGRRKSCIACNQAVEHIR
jgi:hypothetical protein